ncbi:MAG: hypothetical protein ACXW2T_07365 [Allosphingosinicella sp.]
METPEDRSPDGSILARFDVETGLMSHEIWTPTLILAGTGDTLLRIHGTGVDGRPVWRPGGFSLALRHYYHPHVSLSFTADLDRGTFRFDDQDKDERIATLSDRVGEELRRQIAAPPATPTAGIPPGRQPNPTVLWLGLAMLAAAAAWFALS